jgi:hypothetical protein
MSVIDIFGPDYHETKINGATGEVIEEKRGDQVQKDCWLMGIVISVITHCLKWLTH